MKKMKIFFILLIFMISLSAVNAEGSFSDLQDEIEDHESSIDINDNYVFDSSKDTDLIYGIEIEKDNFTINGNGYTIDAANKASIFSLTGYNITIINLNLIDANGSAVNSEERFICINVTFKNNNASEVGAINAGGELIVNNCIFDDNYAQTGSALNIMSTTKIINSTFMNSYDMKYSMIYGNSMSDILIENCRFLNSTAKYATAIYNKAETKIRNCTFIDLSADISAGAIALKENKKTLIENCTFINVKSAKNGGAVFIDTNGEKDVFGNTSILNSTFINCESGFGGALMQLGGKLTIENSVFTNNSAEYGGGSIYISYVDTTIKNTEITDNGLNEYDELSNGGGIYSDISKLTMNNCEITDNSNNGIYAYDGSLNINNSVFRDNGYAIYGIFIDNPNITNCQFYNDKIQVNNSYYESNINEKGMEIKTLNNTIDVVSLPKRFDSREWGWVSSVKDQGQMGSCWTFGTIAALEAALLKYTGVEYDLSENNVQNSMLRYSRYGYKQGIEGTPEEVGIFYALSWFGVIPEEYDSYDELGKVSPLFTSPENIHVQDVIRLEYETNLSVIKKAIMKCGALATSHYSTDEKPYFNSNTSAYYQDVEEEGNHVITIVGWDDNYSASNFLKTPPGDGAWIMKNSWGTSSGINGYFYISYYDKSIFVSGNAFGFIFENTENYTTNYQTDLGGLMASNIYDATEYKNTYTAEENALISAIGTYFENDGEYEIEIYVNDELKLEQEGIATFNGFHTIKLDKEIPVAKNSTFSIVVSKEQVPIIELSRQHYEANRTFVGVNGEWVDLSKDGKTVSLKAYTKDLAIYTEDLVKIYKNDSKFEASLSVANQTVTFEVNGGTYNRTTDERGIVSIAINLIPGNYTIKTTFNGTTVENNVKVLPTLIADNLVKYFRNASQFEISLIDGDNENISGVDITMNINGVFYNRTTNENGTARLNINLAPGEYILTATDPLTGLQMSYNITVLPVLTADDLEMTYKDGSRFAAVLVDGTGKALVNVNITFNINGVFYERATDENGTALLNINLMAGKYIITSQYGSAVISNTITIRD